MHRAKHTVDDIPTDGHRLDGEAWTNLVENFLDIVWVIIS